MSAKISIIPKEAQVAGAEQARDFVTRRIADGSDYIKLVADIPGPDQESLNAAVTEAKKQSKLTIAHALTYEPVQMAQQAKPDFLTHVPIDKTPTDEDIEVMLADKRGCIPTLTIMEGFHKLGKPGRDYENCKQSVKKMHEAGVTILAGTDSNKIQGAPIHIPHGESMARELELLVQAGLSTVEALRSATSETAKRFRWLNDRGVIEPGRRADLVLIDGDPIEDISAVRKVWKVWCGGVEVC